MPAILAKKLGMTQRFTEEGRVERVTVLEAGPCPVTGIRTFDGDGYEAVQLGFGPCARGAHQTELATSRRPTPRGAHPRRFATSRELTVGDTATVEAFEVGQVVKVAARGRAGLAGTSSATTQAARSRTARTTARPADRRLATPSRVFKDPRSA